MDQLRFLFSTQVDVQTGRWRIWLVYFARFSFVLLLLFISLVSLVSGEAGDVEAMGIDDKVAHILAYVVVMGAGLFSVSSFKARMGIFVALLLYSVGLEFVQQMIADGREGSAADALANLSGLVVGVLASKPVGRIFCWLGLRLFPEPN